MAPTYIHSLLTLSILLLCSEAHAFGRFHARDNLNSRHHPGGHHGWPGDPNCSCPPPVTVTNPASALTSGSGAETASSSSNGNGGSQTVTITVTVPGPTVTNPGNTVTIPGVTVTIPGSITPITQTVIETISVPWSLPPLEPSWGNPGGPLIPTGVSLVSSSGWQTYLGSLVTPGPVTVTVPSFQTPSEVPGPSITGPSSSGLLSGGLNGGLNGLTTPSITSPTFCGTQTVVETVFTTLTSTLN
ncbi:hypothetical protein VM1G_09121 [Cytospora mali]|uniref:Uncharacterized protein n=1 Tax=Cytospora mali TaxID=578113 RepID=A0A194WAU2_CYTMA|nr:hypothetical protein VM1G_09121 [Valsa mali]